MGGGVDINLMVVPSGGKTVFLLLNLFPVYAPDIKRADNQSVNDDLVPFTELEASDPFTPALTGTKMGAAVEGLKVPSDLYLPLHPMPMHQCCFIL